MPETYDLVVIGGGIVGLATAYRFSQRYPGQRVVVLEKEPSVAQHQTGRNSGVLHSGVYYRPGSLKATLCRAGKQAMERFCEEQQIPYDLCGKVIVAVDDRDLPAWEGVLKQSRIAKQAGADVNGVASLAERNINTDHLTTPSSRNRFTICFTSTLALCRSVTKR